MVDSIKVDLKQGSDEWIAHRRTKLNASELAAAMGIHPNIKRNTLLRVLATGREIEYADFVRNVIFPKGHADEIKVRALVERDLNEDFEPTCFEFGEYACSLDGLNFARDTTLEIKQFNKELFESVSKGVLPDYQKPQVQQGLWLSNAEKAIFAVGNPDATNYVMMEVLPDAEFISDIPRHWGQFVKDADNFTDFESVEFIPGAPQDSLVPVVNFSGGSIGVTSNVARWFADKKAEYDSLPAEIDADNVTQFKTIGDNMASAKVLIDELLKRIEKDAAPVVDMIGELKSISKYLSKGANHCKNTLAEFRRQIRQEACDKAASEFLEYRSQSNMKLARFDLPVQINIAVPDFMGACSRTKNHESLASAVGAELAAAKIAVDKAFEAIQINLKEFQALAADFKFLFSDLDQLVHKSHDDFVATVKLRIADHKEAKAKEEQAQRERIAAEERARIEAEQVENATQQSTGNDAEATHADDSRDRRPQAPASSTRPYRPSDEEIVRAVADVFGVDYKTAWGWLENFGQEDAA